MSDPFFEQAELQATDGQLASIAELMVAEDQLARAKDTQEALLADISERLNSLRRETIPTAMLAAGVDRFRCAETGSEARVVFECSGALGTDEEERERKLDILIANGAEEIVRLEVLCAFGKGEYERAKEIADELAKRNVATVLRRNIHPMTLKSWVKERMEAGDDLPLDDVGLWYGQIAKIKRPKADG